MLGLSSCQTPGAPKGETCMLDADRGVFRCYDSENDKYYDITIKDADKYIGRSLDYDQKIAAWCKEGWRQASVCKYGK